MPLEAARLSWPITDEAPAEREAAAAGRLPARYGEPWEDAFLARVSRHLRPAISILDVGSGARPVVSPDRRPVGCTYVGLDVSGPELDRAGPGSYDERIVADISSELPSLAGRFDLVLSWQVLEHVPSLRRALVTQRTALIPGGRMIALFSGAGRSMPSQRESSRTASAHRATRACSVSRPRTSSPPATTGAATAGCSGCCTTVAGRLGRSSRATRQAATFASRAPCKRPTSSMRIGRHEARGGTFATLYILEAEA